MNAADPGYTARDLNGPSDNRTVNQVDAGIVRLAGLQDAGAAGGFCLEKDPVPW